MSFKLNENFEDLSIYIEAWGELCRKNNGNGIYASGASNSAEWIQTLFKTRDETKVSGGAISMSPQDILRGVFPYYVEKEKIGGPFSFNVIKHMTELYGSRMRPLIENEEFPELITFFQKQIKQWSKLIFVSISDDESNDMEAELSRNNIKFAKQLAIETPYVDLSCTFKEYDDNLDSKFKKNIRSRRRQLEAEGNVAFTVIDNPSEVPKLLDAIYKVEKNTWKEAEGTSITQNDYQKNFYDIYTQFAAKKGYLQGFILTLDGEPIAYSYCVLFNNVLESLKSSYDDQYRKFGLGNLLKYEIFQYLFEKKIAFFDFQGLIEPSKEKWASKTYKQYRYTVYNPNIYGRIHYIIDCVKSFRK